ncbi:hypothetical protein A0H81_14557 [Grifola frondosa]|uniref:Uncharacterized protein n=1 Tax=Grifola frondosa TaxID=5627 RepID=A0A1C7LND6_GRIFR|nr:hypothetical protein A0H81_14557 [Grifola frondosa]
MPHSGIAREIVQLDCNLGLVKSIPTAHLKQRLAPTTFDRVSRSPTTTSPPRRTTSAVLPAHPRPTNPHRLILTMLPLRQIATPIRRGTDRQTRPDRRPASDLARRASAPPPRALRRSRGAGDTRHARGGHAEYLLGLDGSTEIFQIGLIVCGVCGSHVPVTREKHSRTLSPTPKINSLQHKAR